MNKSEDGFTLMELMAVVVIVGLLSAIAYPSYTEYVNRGHRAECKSAILQTSNLLERFYTANNTYTTDTSAIGGNAFSGNNATSSACSISIAALNSTLTISQSFLITGTPTRTDANCGNLTLDNTGARGESGTQTLAYCW
jgi:type IV pilus assembly protein PilE